MNNTDLKFRFDNDLFIEMYRKIVFDILVLNDIQFGYELNIFVYILFYICNIIVLFAFLSAVKIQKNS